MSREGRLQLVIAVLGLVATVAAALITSWDKIFPPPVPATAAPASRSQATAAAGLPIYRPKQFDGRVGKIFVKNTSLYPFKVTLWHPDNEKIFDAWVVDGTTKFYLTYNSQAFSIGNDWGIQVGDSEIKSIGDAAEWHQNEWRLSQDTFFR